MVGIPSSVYLVLGLTSILAIDIILALKKVMAPPEATQIHFLKESVPSLIFEAGIPQKGMASPHSTRR
jgi:hypothetical protein